MVKPLWIPYLMKKSGIGKLNPKQSKTKLNEIKQNNNKIKLFYTLGKTPLGETGCLRNLYYLLTAQASSF